MRDSDHGNRIGSGSAVHFMDQDLLERAVRERCKMSGAGTSDEPPSKRVKLDPYQDNASIPSRLPDNIIFMLVDAVSGFCDTAGRSLGYQLLEFARECRPQIQICPLYIFMPVTG